VRLLVLPDDLENPVISIPLSGLSGVRQVWEGISQIDGRNFNPVIRVEWGAPGNHANA